MPASIFGMSPRIPGSIAAIVASAACLQGSASAQATKSFVGIHDLEYGLVHPTILPKLKEYGRKLEGTDLALNPLVPFRVKLTPGKRSREYLIDCEPKVGITRLILPGLLNAKLMHGKREQPVRFEIWEARDSLHICNHHGTYATLGGHEIWFVDMDHDGVLGEVTDSYVVKQPKEKSWTDLEGRVKFRTMSDPLVIDNQQHWLQPDWRGFRMVVSCQVPDFASQRDADYETALKLLNTWRQQVGHAPVALREDLSRACEEHALYCANNGLSHEQDPKRPGASARGAKAGLVSEVCLAKSMDGGLRYWLDSFFHRLHMMSPGLQKVGMGHMQGVAVIDAQSDVAARPGVPWHWPVADAVDVPSSWATGEVPSPIGGEFTTAVAAQWGYPITVTFPTAAVRGAVAKVTTGGSELPVFVSSPEVPGNPERRDNECSILVMTRAPLPSGAVIEVSVSCEHAGKPWSKAWRFTTRGR
ncbi:MAG TPA: CAP domain-containing protein [Planctomycetota bacterium]